MKLYTHTNKTKLELRDVDNATTAGTFAIEVTGDERAAVWPEGADHPLKDKDRLGDVLTDRAHVTVTTCKKITIDVRFGGVTKSKTSPPSSTFKAQFAWATGPKGFNLPEDQKATHLLSVTDGTPVDRNDHIGAHADDTCHIALDLRPKERFAG
jgi:hypothetical protein